MKNVQKLERNELTKEELLPEFSTDFPYISSCAELDKHIDPMVPWHWHRTVELFYMESGCLEYATPNGKWVFPAGSGGFVNSNVLHTSRVTQTEESNLQLLHLFEPFFISGEHGNRMEQKYVLPLVSSPGIEMIALYPNDPAQAAILEKIRQAFDLAEQEWGYEFKLREALTEVWMMLFDLARPAMETPKGDPRSNEQIKPMMVHIHENYSHHISVEELAEVAHISKRACFRLFQENLHMTPVEYIKTYRLQMACQMLAKSNEPITEVASQCGLGSSSYFGKTFREEFSCTPLEYRKRWHNRDICGQQ